MEPEKKSNGALVGLVIIVIILIIGGIYYWQNSMKKVVVPEDTNVSESTNATSKASSDTASLEADVNSIDLDSLDSGI